MQLVRNHRGERGLAQSGRPGEQHMVDRLAATAGDVVTLTPGTYADGPFPLKVPAGVTT